MTCCQPCQTPISIHAPREGGDGFILNWPSMAFRFQSTPPARGATFLEQYPEAEIDISIHAPREGGDTTAVYGTFTVGISIHAPREGGD